MSYNPPPNNYGYPSQPPIPGTGPQYPVASPYPTYPMGGQPTNTPYPIVPTGMPTASPSFSAPYGGVAPSPYQAPYGNIPMQMPMPGVQQNHMPYQGQPPNAHVPPNPSATLPVPNQGLQRKYTLPPHHITFEGTVKDYANFNGQQDAEILRKAMKGLGCDDKAVSHVLATRSNKQRQQIKLDFKTLYGKDLIKELKSELSGNHEDVAIALLTSPEKYDAFHLQKAMRGAGTNEEVLIEILSSRTNAQIKKASAAFTSLFQKSLEAELKSETSGHFKRLLVALCQGSRNESDYVDAEKAKVDAKALYQAGEARWGTDESRFNVILADRSFPQLRATFDEYGKMSKHSIEASIEREMSGDLKNGMLAIVKCVKNTPAYFAEKLYKSMKGLGTDDNTLVRVVVSRCEIDLVQIKTEFRGMYGKTLGRVIADDTSGSYKKILLEIVGEN